MDGLEIFCLRRDDDDRSVLVHPHQCDLLTWVVTLADRVKDRQGVWQGQDAMRSLPGRSAPMCCGHVVDDKSPGITQVLVCRKHESRQQAVPSVLLPRSSRKVPLVLIGGT